MDPEKEVVKKYILDMWGNYSETVIDHALNPRNVGSIPEADGFGEGTGECEDTMVIWREEILQALGGLPEKVFIALLWRPAR